ncbi:BREX-3 system phosphatase PglZ [Priestia sp. TRN 1309]|uniref:BREX-3 system phosphatase PglZ n=1 Tax=Priestia sp. TRN 1309 TaxID=3420729 RepID=UPI003D78A9EA
MSSWRDKILVKFQDNISPIILIHDEDYLLNDELIIKQLNEYGYNVVRFEDSISFRYIFEQTYRGKEGDLKLIVYTNNKIVFPFDLLKKGVSFKLNIGTIFPKFSVPILRSMNREDFDALFTVHAQYQGSSSDKDTLEYLIKQLYKIPYEIINNEIELYRILLSLHYAQKEIPYSVQKLLIDNFKRVEVFGKLPIEELISSSTFFYSFIEEQWANLIELYREINEGEINSERHTKDIHPFASHNVHSLINNLFMEGILSKVKVASSTHLPEWMKIGIIEEDYKLLDSCKVFLHLEEKINHKLTNIKLYKDWIEVMELAGEYKYVALKNDDEEQYNQAEEIMVKINKIFQSWMNDQFQALVSLPPLPKPKMVHHIPHVMYAKKENNEKNALVVLDGMSFIQWKQIRKYLKENGFSFEENGVFAWVPTLTSVSRQSIFSGNVPNTFGKTIKTTAAEEKHWKSFWESHGVLKQYVAYQRGLGKEPYSRDNIMALKRNSIKVYGCVVDIIDQLTHHAVLGEKSLVSNLDLWLQTNYLVQLLTDLVNDHYTIYLTSDHGNTNAKGIGRVSEGVLVEQKGERVRIYNDRTLYEDSLSNIQSIAWSNAGLPENYYALFSEYGEAFVTKNEKIVTHGGISIEEVIVPFIKIQKKQGEDI